MKSFALDEIKTAWSYADIAYKKQSELKKQFGDKLTIIDRGIKELGDACYLIEQGDELIITLPGSDDWLDWIMNLINNIAVRDGLYDGFRTQLDKMAPEILTVINDLRPKKIRLQGHSRGAAMAHVLLELYLDDYGGDIDCITFAEPRIATDIYYEAMGSMVHAGNVRYLRVYCEHDPVPMVPLARHGFVHVGESLKLKPKLKGSWWRRLIRYAVTKRFGVKLNVRHHYARTYRGAVERI